MGQTLISTSITLIGIVLTICSKGVHSQDFRLPKSVFPTHYALQLQPILDVTEGYQLFTAPGSILITINCTEDTSTIKLHALDLQINYDTVKVENAATTENLGISSVGSEPEFNFFVINLQESLKSGNVYKIFIEFVTPVSETRLDGMYLDKYVDPATNETRHVATTLFAAINSRRCFPNFDEPQFKAIYSISLARKASYSSLSNRHVVSTEPIEGMDGWFVDRFAPSLPMSSYLVAMIVSDMTFEEAARDNPDDPKIRVYAPYYLINKGGGKYAANQTKTVLSKFEEYYNSKFMLGKLDSVSLPRFFFSAMENWALITYNDKVLLYFPGETTEQERYRITSIIAHEVGHHYFGNLVTCEWWTWIWLNEGFATYVTYFGVEMTYPEFNPWDRFITDVFQAAMEFDSTPATHPVANEPATLADIGGIYDDISYEKGASLLRMLESFLTEPVMKTAIRSYINQRQFSNARQDDLFAILQTTAEELNIAQPASIKDIMDTWTLQPGYPLIRVTRISPTEVRFSQEPFKLDPEEEPTHYKWWIPITIQVLSSTEPKEYFFWMSNEQTETTFPIPDTEVFALNPRSDEYYRTLYSTEMLADILKHFEQCGTYLNFKPSYTKAKLLDDYIQFMKAGLTESSFQNMTSSLCLEEENLLVWQTLLKHYSLELLQLYQSKDIKLQKQLINTSLAKDLQSKMSTALMKLKIRESSPKSGEPIILASEFLFWTCYINPDQELCQYYAGNMMKYWKEGVGNTIIPVDFEDTIYCVAAAQNETHWDRIYSLMKSEHLAHKKLKLLAALSCTDNASRLELIMTELKPSLEFYSCNMPGNWKTCNSLENRIILQTYLRFTRNASTRAMIE